MVADSLLCFVIAVHRDNQAPVNYRANSLSISMLMQKLSPLSFKLLPLFFPSLSNESPSDSLAKQKILHNFYRFLPKCDVVEDKQSVILCAKKCKSIPKQTKQKQTIIDRSL